MRSRLKENNPGCGINYDLRYRKNRSIHNYFCDIDIVLLVPVAPLSSARSGNIWYSSAISDNNNKKTGNYPAFLLYNTRLFSIYNINLDNPVFHIQISVGKIINRCHSAFFSFFRLDADCKAVCRCLCISRRCGNLNNPVAVRSVFPAHTWKLQFPPMSRRGGQSIYLSFCPLTLI